jgi:hypothetical protein
MTPWLDSILAVYSKNLFNDKMLRATPASRRFPGSSAGVREGLSGEKNSSNQLKEC